MSGLGAWRTLRPGATVGARSDPSLERPIVELRHLRYFVAVAEELHFRRAAERLYVAQPAVSEQIRKLETELGVRLFDRTHQRVLLTDAGSALLVEARCVLQQAEAARRAACLAHDVSGSRLKVGYVPDLLPASVPLALHQVAASVPALEVTLESGQARDLLQAVRGRRLDLAVTGLPAPTSGLRVLSLGSERLVAAVPSDRTASTITLEGLASQRLITLPRGTDPALYDAIVAVFHDAGLAPVLSPASEPRIESVLLGVASGGGMSLLPAAAAARRTLPGVRIVELADADPELEAGIAIHPETTRLGVRSFLHVLEGLVRREHRRTALRPAV
jgi:DNA-binding transcriptional LysR family regulator